MVIRHYLHDHDRSVVALQSGTATLRHGVDTMGTLLCEQVSEARF